MEREGYGGGGKGVVGGVVRASSQTGGIYLSSSHIYIYMYVRIRFVSNICRFCHLMQSQDSDAGYRGPSSF